MQDTLSGTVERVTFHSEETGFCVLRVRVRGQRELLTVVGHLANVNEGEYLDARGQWVNDREHGPQMKAEELRATPPTTLEGIQKYLASGMIKGIGLEFAARLVKTFGDRVFSIIENDPSRLTEVPGIGEKRQRTILAAWKDQKVIREIMVFLHSHGVSTSRAVRIYKTYGKGAIERVRENPYRLANDIHGIGFKTADQIAENLGIDRHSQMRAQAGLSYVLRELSRDGHSAYPRNALLRSAIKLLSIPAEILEVALTTQLEESQLVQAPINGQPCIYLPPLLFAENRLAAALIDIQRRPPLLKDVSVDRAMSWVEERVGLTLAEAQKEAIHQALRNRVVIITGGPGVGKTTLLRSLLLILEAGGLECRLCAPTGRAARRLSEAAGKEAKTIHRLLEFKPGLNQFQFNQESPLRCDVVVLDEASMVDVVLMHQLVRAIPAHAAFIIVGDVDQLPSVGPGQVLRDLIESGALPVTRLREVFRQAAASQIITNAHRINHGEIPLSHALQEELGDFYFIESEEPEEILARLRKLIEERIPRRFGLDPVRDIQVLAPMHRSSLGARALNTFLQEFLNPPGKTEVTKFGCAFRVDDKVMQTENNYDKEVFNGDIGFIREIDQEERGVTIDFYGRRVTYDFGELDEIVPAYACSIHKSQGSEYPAVVIPLHTQHYMMLYRNVLYTGVTRAKRLVVVVGSSRALSLAVKRTEQGQRISGLKERLMRSAECGVRNAEWKERESS